MTWDQPASCCLADGILPALLAELLVLSFVCVVSSDSSAQAGCVGCLRVLIMLFCAALRCHAGTQPAQVGRRGFVRTGAAPVTPCWVTETAAYQQMQLQTKTHAGQQLHRRSLLGASPSSAALTCRPSLQRLCKARLQPSAALAASQAPAALRQQQQGSKQLFASSTGCPASRRAAVAQAYSELHWDRLAGAVVGPAQCYDVGACVVLEHY